MTKLTRHCLKVILQVETAVGGDETLPVR